MEENEKRTLTQLAAELGVNKSTLYRRIVKEPLASKIQPYSEMINNKVYYSPKAVEIILNAPEIMEMKKNSEQMKAVRGNETGGAGEYEEDPGMIKLLQESIALLQEQLAVKDSQLEAKDQQLNAKDQQLSAKDEQIISLTNVLRESQAVQKETALALQAAEALHNNTMKQLVDGTKKKKHWWNRKKSDDIIDVDVHNEEGES